MISTDTLPTPIPAYLAAHQVHDTAAEITAFAADATVVDDGSTHVGRDAVEAWMNRTAGEFTYTVDPIAAEQEAEHVYTVTQRIEGDFPGGLVDLRFRFTLADGLITNLVIAP